MTAIAVWGLVLAAVVSMSTSVVSSGLVRAFGPRARRVHPRVRAWGWLALASAPAVASALVVVAVLAPQSWLGMNDHCVPHSDHHPHLCPIHGAPWPPAILVALSLVWAARALGVLGGQLFKTMRAGRALGRLAPEGAVSELPLPGRLAFTAGWLVPRVYATRAVIDGPEWRSVVAHERDHARHRDPLARLLARLALALHPPIVSAWIDRQLVSAQELAADEAAAKLLGDRIEVARALVAWAREPRARMLDGIVTRFEEGDVAGRVRTLLEMPRYVVEPLAALPLAAGLLVLALTAASAPVLHHGVETLLGLLGL